jgi:hypothetical protein
MEGLTMAITELQRAGDVVDFLSTGKSTSTANVTYGI